MEELERAYGTEVAREVESEARRLLGEDPAYHEMADEDVGAEQLAWQTALVLVLVRRGAQGKGA